MGVSIWIAYYDNIPYDILRLDHFGQQFYGSYSRYSGEIRNIEDDMAGTLNDPCTIKACSLKTGGQFQGADLSVSNSDIGSSDFSEWDINLINSTEIRIWDYNPLP